MSPSGVILSVLSQRGASSGSRGAGIFSEGIRTWSLWNMSRCNASAVAAITRSSALSPVSTSTFEYGSIGLVRIATVGPELALIFSDAGSSACVLADHNRIAGSEWCRWKPETAPDGSPSECQTTKQQCPPPAAPSAKAGSERRSARPDADSPRRRRTAAAAASDRSAAAAARPPAQSSKSVSTWLHSVVCEGSSHCIV